MKSRARRSMMLLVLLTVGGTGSGSSLAAQDVQEVSRGCEGWITLEYFELAMPDNVAACLESGMDVMARDDWGRTPLHLAVEAGSPEGVIQLLIEGGADVMAQTSPQASVTCMP